MTAAAGIFDSLRAVRAKTPSAADFGKDDRHAAAQAIGLFLIPSEVRISQPARIPSAAAPSM